MAHSQKQCLQATEPALEYWFSILQQEEEKVDLSNHKTIATNLKGAILCGLGSEIIRLHPEVVNIAENALNPQNVVHKLMWVFAF